MSNTGELRTGAGVAEKSEQQRQEDNDAIAREFIELAKARAERMNIDLDLAVHATIYILLNDYFESRRIGDRTFTSEWDTRRGKKK